MLKQTTTVLAAIAVIGLAGCEADQETFEAGADIDEPAAVEQAPATPIPSEPQPMPPLDSDTMAPPTETDSVGA